MDKQTVKKALEDIKSHSPKRNFSQTYDLIITLQDLNLKNPEQQVEFFANLTNTTGRKVSVCALVAQELFDQSKDACDFVVDQTRFGEYADKKKLRKLAQSYDVFIAQATIMPKIAGIFGRVLGPKGKMPNPKAGCVIPANGNVKAIVDRLQMMVKVSAKKSPIVQVAIGKESQPDEEVVDNIVTIYQQLVHHLPKEKNNIKTIYLKTTMGKPVRVS